MSDGTCPGTCDTSQSAGMYFSSLPTKRESNVPLKGTNCSCPTGLYLNAMSMFSPSFTHYFEADPYISYPSKRLRRMSFASRLQSEWRWMERSTMSLS